MQYYNDELFPKAVDIVLTSRIVSLARLQSILSISPSRAADLISEMESLGIIGPSQGTKPRSILITPDDWSQRKHEYVLRPNHIHQTTNYVYCKYCGRPISSESNFCSSCGSPINSDRPKRKKKKFLWIIPIIIALFFFFLVGSCGNSSSDNSEPISQTLFDQSSFIKNGVGDRIEQDGIYVTLNKVYEISGSEFFKPEPGKVFVICEFTIENESREDIAVSSIVNFEAYFDDYAADYSFAAASSEESKDEIGGNISVHKKMRGITGFEVSKGWSDLQIEFRANPFINNPIVFNYSR